MEAKASGSNAYVEGRVQFSRVSNTLTYSRQQLKERFASTVPENIPSITTTFGVLFDSPNFYILVDSYHTASDPPAVKAKSSNLSGHRVPCLRLQLGELSGTCEKSCRIDARGTGIP